jgi:hypothetical protein
VKDPSLRDTLYVEGLIGPETISTMPEETIRAFQDHGRVELRLESDLDDAQYVFNKLYAAGVDYDDDVVATLEREGIEKFVASFNELLKRVGERRRHLSDAVGGDVLGAVSPTAQPLDLSWPLSTLVPVRSVLPTAPSRVG